MREKRMEEGEGGGEGRLRREQSAGLGCCGSPEAVLGSAFTPPLQQCKAAAQAACCSLRPTAKQGRGFLRTLDSGFCSSAARHAPAPTSLHTHAAPLLFWFFLCTSVLVLYLGLMCPPPFVPEINNYPCQSACQLLFHCVFPASCACG